MTDFPFVSTENFAYSPAEDGGGFGSDVEAHFCLYLKTIIKNISL